MPWVQFCVETGRADAGTVSAAFEAAGALSVSLQDAGAESLLEPAPGAQPLWPKVRVVALFPADCNTEAVARTLQAALQRTDIAWRVEELPERDWSNTWREGFPAMRFGARLWVCPDGESPDAADAVVLRLDPGLAFGTGTHETTALCLEWLDACPPVGRSVIDYGCGSGILAIAAHRLGARPVYAVDIDPQARLVARDNARRNGIEQGFEVLMPQALPAQPADVLLANILANPLIALAGELARRVRLRGHLVLSGILEAQAAAVMAAYRPQFEFAEPVRRAGWLRLEGTRQPATVARR